jgi:hypothetical protein
VFGRVTSTIRTFSVDASERRRHQHPPIALGVCGHRPHNRFSLSQSYDKTEHHEDRSRRSPQQTIKLIVWDLSPRIDMIGLVDEQWDAVHTSDWFNLRSLLSPLTPRSQGLRPTNISILSRASLCWGRNVEESPEALPEMHHLQWPR